MDDLTVVPDPVFWATMLATLVPFVTALLVRLNAEAWVKATVATGLTVADALLVTWRDADAAGQSINLKVLLVALATALTWQRVVHRQVNVPYRIEKKMLPDAGLH